jgi:hypothetical protein
MRQSATRELFDYWNALRGERAAPERAEIDPAAIRNVLAETFMLEVDLAHKFPIRLSGTRINALFCAEQKKEPFVDLWAVREARNVAAILATVAEQACPVIAGAVAAPKGYDELEIEILFLPLRHAGDMAGPKMSHANARILGSLSAARRPPWLGLLPVEKLALRSLRTFNESVPPLMSGLIPDLFPSNLSAPKDKFEMRGHLRVFPGGRRDFLPR